MRDLNLLVEQWQQTHRSVPYFDPDSGGIRARVVLLLEAPGPKAAVHPSDTAASSSFVSLDNNDQSAENLFCAVAAAGLSRSDVVVWNVIPWYVGDDDHSRIAPGRVTDTSRECLARVLDLLPDMRVAVLLGQTAQLGWLDVCGRRLTRIPGIGCPHPSGRVVNRKSAPGALKRQRYELIVQALCLAKEMLDAH